MNIKSRGINRGECFLCDKKYIANLFKDDPIQIFFGRRKNLSDKTKKDVVAELVLRRYDVRFMNIPSDSLYLYPVQATQDMQALRESFQTDVLPRLHEMYLQKKDCFLGGKTFGDLKIQIRLKDGGFSFL